MANKKALFGILDPGDGTGSGIDKVVPDTTTAASIACTLSATIAKKSTGELTYICLNADGSVPVDAGGAGNCKHGYAKVTGSTSFQDLGEIPAVTVGKVYSEIGFNLASSTEACWEVVYIDDAAGTPAETVLYCAVTGPGQYSHCCQLCVDVDTTGGTGTQQIVLRGKLLDSTGSELCGTVSAKESA